MYLYSKKAQENYLKYPIESFFLAHFASSTDGKSYIRSKPDNSEKSAKTERIMHDILELRDFAITSLSSHPCKKMFEFFLDRLVNTQ